jgi:gas vesicle protein
MVTLSTGLERVIGFASEQVEGLLGNPVATAVGGAAVGAVVGGAATYAVTKAKTTRSKSTKKRSRKAPSRRKRSGTSKRTRKYARTAGKRKDKSTRRIRMTKNGQPYVIMASGKARFISKKSARSSRKRKGGRY